MLEFKLQINLFQQHEAEMQQTINDTQTLSINRNNECNTFKQNSISINNSAPHKYAVSLLLILLIALIDSRATICFKWFCCLIVSLALYCHRSFGSDLRSSKSVHYTSQRIQTIKYCQLVVRKMRQFCVLSKLLFNQNWIIGIHWYPICWNSDRFIIDVAFQWWKWHRQFRILKFNSSKHQFNHTNVIVKSTANFAVIPHSLIHNNKWPNKINYFLLQSFAYSFSL